MFWQYLRKVLLTGAFAVAAVLPARAGDCCAPAPCTTSYKSVCCTEWVPETYQTTRTVYKTECRQEAYTAYKTECVPETRTVTCNRIVCEPQTQMRTVCVRVPVVEEKVVMQSHWTCKPVTKMVRKCVDKGHYECREVPCTPTCGSKSHKWLSRKKDCCDPCANACADACCVPTKTVRVWVPCPVWEECAVTCMERVCEQRPVTVRCCSYRMESKQEACTVMVSKCVPETKTVTVMVSKCVPYQAMRTVSVCVPTTEAVTCTRMVARTVTKQVPCEATCCATTCCKVECCETKCKKVRRCSGLSLRGHGSCCD